LTQRFPLRNAAGTIIELVTIRTDITYRKKIEQEAASRAMWAERLAVAIGDGRLLVYSQPIVDIATRATVAEELLVRLRAADSAEVLPPGDFLPQCEEYGLLPVVDRYMVGRAIDLAAGGMKVSVNITGQTIGDEAVMDEILAALAAAGRNVTENILFEITETTALASPATARAFSTAMGSLGCRVALDDFGTGYGTFTELRHLELDELKIDLSFVQNMLESRDDERVVNTIAFVAREYGLTTVAEGVETEATLQRLAELGVDYAQGYLFGRPRPVTR
jgi:EAL domain-containing protein (putative c-di-GMP-specific phosphodiesterase class I)